MAYFLGAVAFVVALLVTVMLHEGGHLVAAKRFGMKATQYFVGFGPTLFSWRRGETEYGVKAIPLGGFVRIVGYTPLEDVPPEDRDRAFFRQPAGRRAVVIAAGVVVNFVFAFLLLAVMAMTVGVRDPGTATSTAAEVSPCVPADLAGKCGPGRPRSPAAAAGLRPGDRIVRFGGRPVADWAQLRSAIGAAKPGQTVPITVERPGAGTLTLRARLADVGGAPFLGMSAKVVGAGWDRRGPGGALAFAADGIGSTLGALGSAVADLPSAIPRLFSPDRGATPGGQVGSVVGATEASGQIFSAHGTAREKIALYLSLVVSVNIFLGALNVVPLLPLDGGHLAVVAYQKARAGVNRVRGRPDPGTVDLTRMMPLTYLAVVLLVGFGVLLILADLINPLQIPG
ncbi:M50 family metallopeptidase [Actinomadura atramentaria]|uniref:M50 family metallopeptidase n=1 Tax=Actinomadura atramentaria TaxID=1990 RepID=UPI0003713C58|nr:RIP metalloprotease [Actinomadura atramentaria]